MGHLQELVKLNLLVHGGDEVENYKNNTKFFYEKYRKTDQDVKAVRLGEIKAGQFYFFHYMDDSKWIMYSPVYVIDYKKFDNMIILNCINFNFLPLKFRSLIFDPYIGEQDFENKNFLLKAKYDLVYKELRKIGFQWSIMEYNVAQIKLAHRISMDMLPRFLYSGHPLAKYDPVKLVQIWKKKYGEMDMRDKEMMSATIDDFYDVNKEISNKYDVLQGHIKRLQKSTKKYGGK